jgi:succinate dehydrogenase hydrophobic anchor subunit
VNQRRIKPVEEKNLSRVYVQFIDILFAVVIGQSFVLLSSGAWFATWLAQPLQNAFGIATLVLVYVLLITSWIGYHQSVQQFPIKSVWRFLIDIILLLVYYMGFVYASNFQSVTLVFALSFVLYTTWDALRVREYYSLKRERGNLLKRFGISAGFMAGFAIIALVYLPLTSMIPGVQWALFLAIALLLVVYRILKWYR